MDFRRKRWLCLIAGVLIEALLGIGYAWSVFQGPFIEKYGWSISGISNAYTLMYVATMLITLFFGQKLRRLLPIRYEVMLGGAIYALSIFGMSIMKSSVLELCFWWGIVLPLGTALSYPVLISYALEIFPEKGGFAGGLMTAGYGIGSVIWAPLTSYIYTSTGDISVAFRILSIIFGVGIVLLSFLLKETPAGFREQMLAQAAEKPRPDKPLRTQGGSLYNIGKQEMLRKPALYIAMLSLLLGLACGGMTVSQGSPIAKQVLGMTETAAAAVVSLLSVANVAGRLLWGAVSDRLGKLRTITLLHGLMALSMGALLVFKAQIPFILALMGTLLSYGGFTCLVAPATAELFGNDHISENYTVTFCCFGLSSFVGPALVSKLRESTGAYSAAFACAAAFAILGAAASFYLARKRDRALGKFPPRTPLA